MEDMISSGEKLENLKVRRDVKHRLDTLQVQLKSDGSKVTQSDLIAWILDDFERLRAGKTDPLTPRTIQERERVGQLMGVLRTSPADENARLVQESVIRALDLWARFGSSAN